MGWIPTAVDLSTWNSIWAVEKIKSSGMEKSEPFLFDFNFGYIITAVLALCFLTLGAFVMYGSGEEHQRIAPYFLIKWLAYIRMHWATGHTL